MHATLHATTIRRSQGRSTVGASAYRSGSVVACAAYRAGDKIKDDQQGKTHDYTKKHHVLHSEIITPKGAPEWMTDREQLWNAVEAGEKRKDAQLAREFVLTLPRNLDHEQHKAVVREFIQENLTKRGLVADYSIHNPEASDGGHNPHAHIMFTLRPVDGDGFGKKQTGYRGDGLDSKYRLAEFRNSYETILNAASEKANSEIRFDLRSLKERGIDRAPQPKIGPKVTYLEKKGYVTEWGKEVRQVQHSNHAKAAQTGHKLYNQVTSRISRAVDDVRDDIAHKYYEVMYGPEAAYDDHQKDRDSYGHDR